MINIILIDRYIVFYNSWKNLNILYEISIILLIINNYFNPLILFTYNVIYNIILKYIFTIYIIYVTLKFMIQYNI
jgi:hypothetical protein